MRLPNSSVRRVLAPFGRTDLGDPRRTRRLRRVVEKVARAPSGSLPAALGDDAQVQGAYRLMNNPAMRFETLLGVQVQATRMRAEDAASVLVLHDTTDCSFPNQDPAEIGYLNTGKAGFRLHLSLVIDAKDWKRPLGISYAEPLMRPNRRRAKGRGASGPTTAKWADREFLRWWRGMEASADALKSCKRVVHIADREGDSFELMAKLVAAKQRFVIRVRVDRRGRDVDSDAEGWSTVRQVAADCEGMLERDVPLSRRTAKTAPAMNRAHPPRKARIARLRFAATRIVIPRPQYLPAPKHLELNLVHVFEVDCPPGEPAVEWLLYTTEAATAPTKVAAIVDMYRSRWMIEELNGALKTGCAYEQRQFESRHALLAILALSLPIACEVLWLRSRARSTPEAPATEVLTTQQLRILRKLGPYPLSAKPTAVDALLAVAGLGGHLKRNGPPGWKILQRGMALLLAYEVGWEARAK
jgi:Transposase DNA-binding